MGSVARGDAARRCEVRFDGVTESDPRDHFGSETHDGALRRGGHVMRAPDPASLRLAACIAAVLAHAGCHAHHGAGDRDAGPTDAGPTDAGPPDAALPSDGGAPCDLEPGAALYDVVALSAATARPTAMDGAGRVYGFVEDGPAAEPRAFRWSQEAGLERLDDVLALADGTVVSIEDARDDGSIAGALRVGGDAHAFVWTPEGGLVDLSLEDGPSSATAILADGSVLVNAERRASLRTAGTMLPLGLPPDGDPRRALVDGLAASASGVVIGASSSDASLDVLRAFRFTTATGLELLPSLGGQRDRAHAVRADGRTIVGTASTLGSDVMRPVLWRDGTIEAIPLLEGVDVAWGAALDVNERGLIVGVDQGPDLGGPISLGWILVHDRKIALDALLADRRWQIRRAIAIDDALRIAAVAHDPTSARDRAVLLVPRCRF